MYGLISASDRGLYGIVALRTLKFH